MLASAILFDTDRVPNRDIQLDAVSPVYEEIPNKDAAHEYEVVANPRSLPASLSTRPLSSEGSPEEIQLTDCPAYVPTECKPPKERQYENL